MSTKMIQHQSISEGSLGSGPKAEYLSCMRESMEDKSRAQNFSGICQVDEEKEEVALG